ncbi:MAG: phospholipase D-like domain-containing protein, partial [Candidatus Hadarchaeales archaeon]
SLLLTRSYEIVLDRLVIRDEPRLSDSIEMAWREGGERLKVIIIDEEFSDPDEFPDIRKLDELPRVEIKYANLPGNGLYHAKTIVVDGRAGYVGSANWSSSSMIGRRELGVYFEDENLASAVEEIFRKDWNSKYVKHVLPQPNRILEFFLMAGVIFGIFIIVVILLQEHRKRKAIRRRREWVAELWGSLRHEI